MGLAQRSVEVEVEVELQPPDKVSVIAHVKLHPSGMEIQPPQQTAAAMTVDFDAVFGNKATPSNNGPQPAAGKARPVRPPGRKLNALG